MNRRYGNDVRPVCGYDSCPCRGVHFISCYQEESDYCIDGERVAVNKETGAVRKATPLQIKKLITHYAIERTKYEVWHATMLQRYGNYLSPLAAPKPTPHVETLAA